MSTDTLSALTLLSTVGLGIYTFIQTHKINKRTQFINTVTSERVKWIQELRKNISDLSGAVHTWATIYANVRLPEEREGEKELLERIDRLRYLIRLQLNPRDYPDNEIEELIAKIPALTNQKSLDAVMEALDALTRKTQILLKVEWEKVKTEAITGKMTEDGKPCGCGNDRS